MVTLYRYTTQCRVNCYIYVFSVVYVMTNNWNTELSCSIQHVFNLVTSY